jgi:hypothetical protein
MILYQEYPWGSFGHVTRFPTNSLVFQGNIPKTISEETIEGFPIDYFFRSFFAFRDYEGVVRLGYLDYVDGYNSWISEPWHPPTEDNPLVMYSRYWKDTSPELYGSNSISYTYSQCGQLTFGSSVLYEDTPVALSDILDSESGVVAAVGFSTPDDFQWENKINTFEVLV